MWYSDIAECGYFVILLLKIGRDKVCSSGKPKTSLYILKVNIFYKYFFKKLSPVIFRNSRHFLNFLLYEMFFGLPLDVDLKSQKFKKWREFLIITGLSF